MQLEDIDAVKGLFVRVYGYGRTRAEDVWRYTKTESGSSPVILAEKDGALVGCYAVWQTRIVCGSEIIPAAQALDIMVAPQHHGKGLFTLMGEAMFRELEARGITMLYGFPNPPSYLGHTHKMNWHHVTDVPRYIRFIHPLHHLRFIPKIIVRIGHRIFDMAKPSSNTKIISEKPSPELLEKIIRNTQFPKYSCHILRDSKWFAWRYDDSSELAHGWLHTQKGFAVFRIQDGIIRISELWGDTHIILQHIIRIAYERDVTLVMIVTNLPQLKKTLWRNLFVSLDSKPFIVRPLTTKSLPANIHTPENWHIMSGDFDAM